MKIGIISFWNSQNNYGQILQCYAIQQLIKKLGHDPIHIKFNDKPLSFKKKLFRLIGICLSPSFFSFLKLIKDNNKANKKNNYITSEFYHDDRKFDEFRNKYLSFTLKEYSQEDLLDNPPVFDAYICGSDQIWSFPSIPYMLQFGPKSVKRLSIAASMGGVKINNKYLKSRYRKYLKNFDFVSLREDSGTNEIINLGRKDAVTVLDPTLYLSKELFKNIAVYPDNQDYLFVYLLGNKIDIHVDEIFEWANKNRLEIVYVTASGRVDEFKKVYPTINEWLGYIVNAKYVITNSFHGMALSIVLEKQFLTIPLTSEYARMNDRITEILDKFNLRSRLFVDDFESIKQTIDYIGITEKRLSESSRFLSKIDSILKK